MASLCCGAFGCSAASLCPLCKGVGDLIRAHDPINGDSADLKPQAQALLGTHRDQSLEMTSGHEAFLRRRVLQKASFLQGVADCVSQGRKAKTRPPFQEAARLASMAI